MVYADDSCVLIHADISHCAFCVIHFAFPWGLFLKSDSTFNVLRNLFLGGDGPNRRTCVIRFDFLLLPVIIGAL